MPAMAERPYLSSFRDAYGKTRWRFRRGRKTISLRGSPGQPAFEAAYAAAIEGRRVRVAAVERHPGSVVPRSLRAAWLIVLKSADWNALRDTSREQQQNVAERFLMARVDPAASMVWGDVLSEHVKRRHVRAILAGMSDTPHAGAMVLRLLRKLTGVALDEEWIEVDPTYRVKHRPEYGGWRAWTAAERSAFEGHWPIGSTPRLAYALALYTGQRRADVANMRWADIEAGSIHVVQGKTGRELWLPILPALAEALAATPRSSGTILVTQYGQPFSVKALGMRMQDWTRAAGLPAGVTMHGLRKTMGKLLAEGGATTRELMDVLGHKNIQHAELYSREAEQRHLAKSGMAKLKPALRLIKKDG